MLECYFIALIFRCDFLSTKFSKYFCLIWLLLSVNFCWLWAQIRLNVWLRQFFSHSATVMFGVHINNTLIRLYVQSDFVGCFFYCSCANVVWFACARSPEKKCWPTLLIAFQSIWWETTKNLLLFFHFFRLKHLTIYTIEQQFVSWNDVNMTHK